MFVIRQVVLNPVVLRRHKLFENKFLYRSSIAEGVFCKVIPATWKEISYIKLLEKGVSYEVPYEGNGLLIKDSAMPR